MTPTKRSARELAEAYKEALRVQVVPGELSNGIIAALERAAEQDEWLTLAKQSYTCPFCNEVYGPRKISTEDLREAVRLHAPTCDKHPLTQRIASLEAKLSDRDDTIASIYVKIDEAHAALNEAEIKDSVGGGHLIARIRDAGRRISALEAQLAEFKAAEQKISASYLRIREMLSAWRTPDAPTPEQVYEHTEVCLREKLAQLAAAQADLKFLDDRLCSADGRDGVEFEVRFTAYCDPDADVDLREAIKLGREYEDLRYAEDGGI